MGKVLRVAVPTVSPVVLNHREQLQHRTFMDLRLEGKQALVTGSTAEQPADF